VLSHEVRAWPIPQGTHAVDAAGRIHTDMAQGFIRAEVIAWDTLVAAGSLRAARERGLTRLEGRDYVVRDGDVITFRFAT
jgi:ribosome-binding ATPase YchF (GTP1/OBG family)